MADLFISHSSMDVAWTRELRSQLEAAGYTCWMAPDDVNGPTPWAEQILEAIEACRVMIIVVSRHANASAHVSKEVGAALEHDKPLLPIRTEAIVPTGSLNYLLQLVQWIDAFPGTLAQHLDRIQRAVAYAIPATATPAGSPSVAAPPSPPPLDPNAAWPAMPATPMPPPVGGSAPAAAPAYAPMPGYATPAAPWTPAVQPAGGTSASSSRTPLLLAGGAGLVTAAVILVGALALAPHPSPTAPPSGIPGGLGGQSPSPPTYATSPATPPPAPTATPAESPTIAPTPTPTAPPTASPNDQPLTLAELTGLLPTVVDGISISYQPQTGVEALKDAGSANAGFRAFLNSHGKRDQDLLVVVGRDASGTSDLTVGAVYVPGIPVGELKAAVLASTTAGTGATNRGDFPVGGRQVTVMADATFAEYLYTEGRVVYVIGTSVNALAADAIAQTPPTP